MDWDRVPIWLATTLATMVVVAVLREIIERLV